jgi:hypothetical protein
VSGAVVGGGGVVVVVVGGGGGAVVGGRAVVVVVSPGKLSIPGRTMPKSRRDETSAPASMSGF